MSSRSPGDAAITFFPASGCAAIGLRRLRRGLQLLKSTSDVALVLLDALLIQRKHGLMRRASDFLLVAVGLFVVAAIIYSAAS
jgi:hypothetical protein